MHHADGDAPVVVKAFWMGHVSTGHRAHIETDEATGLPCIHCDTCWESWT